MLERKYDDRWKYLKCRGDRPWGEFVVDSCVVDIFKLISFSWSTSGKCSVIWREKMGWDSPVEPS